MVSSKIAKYKGQLHTYFLDIAKYTSFFIAFSLIWEYLIYMSTS